MLNFPEINQEKIEQIWMVDLLLLMIKSIRSFRQKQNINEEINVYCELTQEWKDKLDPSFDLNHFLFPLIKSKTYFSLPEKEKKELSYTIIDIKPFGILKIKKEKDPDWEQKLTKKLEYYQKEYKRAQGLLENDNFIKKAPSLLIKKEQDKLNYFAEQKRKIFEKLNKL